MCLIVYSPAGTLFDYETFDCAQAVNPDGIGIMSERGVERFLGTDAGEDAWRHLRDLEHGGVPYGIHFRMATHGEISLENCHPFHAPRSDALVMHNGIIRSTAHLATRSRSDTALFVEKFMGSAPGPERSHHDAYFQRISRLIGAHNTLLVFHSNTAEFTICNDDVGLWMGDHWYSNSDCLPWNLPPEGEPRWLDWMNDPDWLPDELLAERTGEWPGNQEGFEMDLRGCSGWCTRDPRPDTMDD
jgi:hypothetical protein